MKKPTKGLWWNDPDPQLTNYLIDSLRHVNDEMCLITYNAGGSEAEVPYSEIENLSLSLNRFHKAVVKIVYRLSRGDIRNTDLNIAEKILEEHNIPICEHEGILSKIAVYRHEICSKCGRDLWWPNMKKDNHE